MYGDEMYRHEASGLELAKKLALPASIEASDVFRLTDEKQPVGLASFDRRGFDRHGPLIEAKFDGYVRMPNYSDSGPCELTNPALDALKARAIGYCGMSLEVINWSGKGEGWSLIVSHFNEILGGVWLAVVRTDSLPHRQPVEA